jgi:nitrile hydratase
VNPSSHGHSHDAEISDVEARVLALESLLSEKQLVTSDEVDAIISQYENDIGPMLGARVVAKAWCDPDFKARLLADGSSAIEELGIESHDLQLVAVENRPGHHNMVVCTLCSCYPWFLLGLPPNWYKSAAYRSRAVIEPREVLGEFGLEVGPGTEIKVWDSTADMRYMVLPERPSGTDDWSEEELARIVTRESMIGTGQPRL